MNYYNDMDDETKELLFSIKENIYSFGHIVHIRQSDENLCKLKARAKYRTLQYIDFDIFINNIDLIEEIVDNVYHRILKICVRCIDKILEIDI